MNLEHPPIGWIKVSPTKVSWIDNFDWSRDSYADGQVYYYRKDKQKKPILMKIGESYFMPPEDMIPLENGE